VYGCCTLTSSVAIDGLETKTTTTKHDRNFLCWVLCGVCLFVYKSIYFIRSGTKFCEKCTQWRKKKKKGFSFLTLHTSHALSNISKILMFILYDSNIFFRIFRLYNPKTNKTHNSCYSWYETPRWPLYHLHINCTTILRLAWIVNNNHDMKSEGMKREDQMKMLKNVILFIVTKMFLDYN